MKHTPTSATQANTQFYQYHVLSDTGVAHKTIQVVSEQFNKTSSACHIVHPSPKPKSFSVPIYPLFSHLRQPPALFPHGCHHTLSVYVCVCAHACSLIPSPPFFKPPPLPSDQAVGLFLVSMPLFPFFIIRLFCSLDSTHQ